MKLSEAVRKAKRVYVIGNGGSAANAAHIVNDLLSVGVKAFDVNEPFFSATANDYGYEVSFSKWIGVVGERGDLLIALSGSGSSPNILRAIERARNIGMETVLVTNYLKEKDMQGSEEEQLSIGHSVMKELCEKS